MPPELFSRHDITQEHRVLGDAGGHHGDAKCSGGAG